MGIVPNRRQRARVSRAIGTFVASLLTGCAFSPLPLGGTAQSRDSHHMWVSFFWIGLAVAIVMLGLIVYPIWAFRERPGRAAKQFRNNRLATWFYVGIPFVLVGFLYAISLPAEDRIEALTQAPALRVNVTGFRWSWRFAYPELGASVAGTPEAPPTFELPLGETARMSVTSADVDHSFWIPGFLFKRDAIPGLINEFDWTPTKLGTYRGECGEFCGLDHAVMLFKVAVVTRPVFDAWVRAHK